MRRKSSSYDLIHAHSLTSGVAVSELARTLGLPLMTSVSPSCLSALGLADDASATSSPCALRSDLLHRSNCIVVSGDQDAKSLRSLPSSVSSDMQVMPIGFDPQELRVVGRPAARASLRWHPQHFSIVQFAQIEPADGLEITIRALAEIRRSGIANAQLYLVGGNCESSTAGSSERQRLLGIAHALGVADAVHFTGRVRQDVLRHHYYAADVFVSTAFQGGRAAPVLQAMACGLPVIASAVEDMRSLISDGDNGYLVNTGDIHQLAKHLCELHADGDLRERFGDTGRKLAYARHSWRTISAALADIYERLIRNKASQPLREPAAEPHALEIASAA